jgi:hypothetical protein
MLKVMGCRSTQPRLLGLIGGKSGASVVACGKKGTRAPNVRTEDSPPEMEKFYSDRQWIENQNSFVPVSDVDSMESSDARPVGNRRRKK